MKGFKKALSLLMIAAMLSASFVTAQAATKVTTNFTSSITAIPTGWAINSVGAAYDTAENYIRVTTEGKTGYGLVLNQIREVVSNSYMQLYRSANLSIPAGTYTLSYWIKGTGNAPKVIFNVAENKNHRAANDLLDGEWHQVTQEFTSTKDNTNVKILMERPTNCVIDDLSIKDANGTEYVANGNFETMADKTVLTSGDNYYNSDVTTYYYAGSIGTSSNNYDRETHYMRGTDLYKHGGKYGLHMKHTNASAANTLVRSYVGKRITVTNGVKYRAEVWVKKSPDITPSQGPVRFYFTADSNSDDEVGRLGNKLAATNVEENGFVRYEHTYTETKTATNQLIIQLHNKADLVIDDFKLYQIDAATGAETVVYEEDFEDVYPFEYYAEGKYDSTWREGSNLIANVDPDGDGRFVFVEPTKKVARDNGGYSMKFHYPYISATNTYLFIDKVLDTPLTEGSYTLTYYTYGNVGNLKVGTWGDGFVDQKTGTNELQQDGWTKWTVPITVDGTGDTTAAFQATAGNFFYLDDISLVDANGKEYITDGGFDATEVADFASAMNLSALPTGNAGEVAVTWTNPNASALENVILYVDNTNYGPQDNAGNLLSTISRTSGKTNNITINKLSNYVPHTIKVVATVDGVNYTATATVTPDDKGTAPYTMGDWTVSRGNPVIATVNLDRAVKTEGNAALRFDINNKTAVSEKPNIYQAVTYASGTPYSVIFKAKAENITSFKVVESVAGTETVLMEADANGSTHDWQEYKVDIAAKEAETEASIMFVVEKGTGSLWLDDVKVQTVLPNGTVIGESLIANGGFEYDDYVVSAPVFTNVTDKENVRVIEALEAGTIEVKVNINNYTKGNSFKPALAVALYDGATLVSAPSFIEQTVVESAIDGIASGTLAVTVAVPEMTEGTDYNLKVMVWDGMASMKPLTEAVSFK